MEEKLSVGYADGERHKEDGTRKRVGKFDAQVRKGVRDMKVRCYTIYVHLILSFTVFTLFKE